MPLFSKRKSQSITRLAAATPKAAGDNRHQWPEVADGQRTARWRTEEEVEWRHEHVGPARCRLQPERRPARRNRARTRAGDGDAPGAIKPECVADAALHDVRHSGDHRREHRGVLPAGAPGRSGVQDEREHEKRRDEDEQVACGVPHQSGDEANRQQIGFELAPHREGRHYRVESRDDERGAGCGDEPSAVQHCSIRLRPDEECRIAAMADCREPDDRQERADAEQKAVAVITQRRQHRPHRQANPENSPDEDEEGRHHPSNCAGCQNRPDLDDGQDEPQPVQRDVPSAEHARPKHLRPDEFLDRRRGSPPETRMPRSASRKRGALCVEGHGSLSDATAARWPPRPMDCPDRALRPCVRPSMPRPAGPAVRYACAKSNHRSGSSGSNRVHCS